MSGAGEYKTFYEEISLPTSDGVQLPAIAFGSCQFSRAEEFMTELVPPTCLLPTDFESQYQRILKAAGCRTQAELAEFLEIQQPAISDARRRKSIPAPWLLTLLDKQSINPDWIRCGNGATHLAPVDPESGQAPVIRVTEVRLPQQCTTQDLVNELVRRALSNALS